MPRRAPLKELDVDDRKIIEYIAKAGMVDLDRLVNRFFKKENESLVDAQPRAMETLKRFALQEYLQARPVVIDMIRADTPDKLGKVIGKHYFTLAYCITPRAARDFNSPLPPTIRENFVQHHIKTLDAIFQVEKQVLFSGEGRVVDFKMESQLVRENFKGKLFRPNSGTIVPQFPDAQIVIRRSDGTEETVNVEYVSSKYTDEMIREKHKSFAGRTVWAAPNSSTAARVQAITGSPAVLV